MRADPIIVEVSHDELVAFMTLVAFGAGLVTVDVFNAQATYQRLLDAQINGGYLIMARTHVWAARARLGMKCLMLLASVFAIFRWRRLIYWPMLALVLLMDVDSIRFRQYRDRSVEAERKERERRRSP